MKEEFEELEMFAMKILNEFSQTLQEILMTNPTLSKKRIFETLFEVGDKKHSRDKSIEDSQFGKDFTDLLTKTNMEYSCFLAYAAGCLKGAFWPAHSRADLLEMVKPIAKIGKQIFLHRT